MPQQVIIAFCGEGKTDHYALPHLLRRIVEDILISRNAEIEVVQPLDYPLPDLNGQGVANQYRSLANKATGAHLICVHHDAGNLTLQERRRLNFEPGAAAVGPGGKRRPVFIPVIPVREMEAWLLADTAAIEDVVGDVPSNVPLPSTHRDLERLQDPKLILSAIIEAQTHHLSDHAVLLEALAEELDLQALSALPAVQSLRRELEEGLTRQGFLRPH